MRNTKRCSQHHTEQETSLFSY